MQTHELRFCCVSIHKLHSMPKLTNRFRLNMICLFLMVRTQKKNEEVLISPYPDLLPDVVGRNRECRWKEGSIRVPKCNSFLLTGAERKHVRRRARFQQHRDASCHQVSFSARQGAEGNSRNSERNITETCIIVCHCQKLGGRV